MNLSLWRRTCCRGALMVAGGGALIFGAAEAQDAVRLYYVNDPIGRNVVTIMSDAQLGTMLTRTSDIKADIAINAQNVLAKPRARFEIDMNSLDTGIPLRNQTMRSAQWMDTQKYPKATFVLTKVLAPTGIVPLEQGKTMNGEIEGDLTVRGVTKTVRAQLMITTLAANEDTKTRLSGDLMQIRAQFPLNLQDFNIDIPAPARLKIAPVQQVMVNVFSSTGSEKPQLGAAADAAPAANVALAKGRTMNDGLVIEDVKIGDGKEATAGQSVTVHYRGTLMDGTKFDASYDRNEPFTFKLGAGDVIQGWDEGVAGMKVGGKRILTIPPALGYGARGAGNVIPPNATLKFEVELLKVG